MHRSEALRILGLEEGATEEEIKLAYREAAQILHPDRFNGNEKLKDRATEQFKAIAEARDVLLGKGSRNPSAPGGYADVGSNFTQIDVLRARLAALEGARINVISNMDAEADSRNNGLLFMGIGALLCLFARRQPLLLTLGSTGLIWGIIRVFSAQANMKSYNKHLREIEALSTEAQKELDAL